MVLVLTNNHLNLIHLKSSLIPKMINLLEFIKIILSAFHRKTDDLKLNN